MDDRVVEVRRATLAGVVSGLTLANTLAWQQAISSIISLHLSDMGRDSPAKLVASAIASTVLCGGALYTISRCSQRRT